MVGRMVKIFSVTSLIFMFYKKIIRGFVDNYNMFTNKKKAQLNLIFFFI
jgi:hypothetical protein